ncbi:hypothetical protein B0H14DRAFT_2987853, partial [Mycena olivaceomarginata]
GACLLRLTFAFLALPSLLGSFLSLFFLGGKVATVKIYDCLFAPVRVLIDMIYITSLILDVPISSSLCCSIASIHILSFSPIVCAISVLLHPHSSSSVFITSSIGF